MTNARLRLHHFFHWMNFDWLSCKSRALYLKLDGLARMTQPFRFHVINNSKCFLNSQSGLNVSSKSKSYLNRDYTSTPSSKVKKITRCCTVLPVLRVINNSRWWRRPLTVSAGVNRQEQTGLVLSLFKTHKSYQISNRRYRQNFQVWMLSTINSR